MNILKKSLAYLLVFAMVMAIVPFAALAANTYVYTLVPDKDMESLGNRASLPLAFGTDGFFTPVGDVCIDIDGSNYHEYDRGILLPAGQAGAICFTTTGEADVTVIANCQLESYYSSFGSQTCYSDLGLYDADGQLVWEYYADNQFGEDPVEISGYEYQLVEVEYANLPAGTYYLKANGNNYWNGNEYVGCGTRVFSITVEETTDHTHSFAEVVIPATCTEIGYTKNACSCGIGDIYDVVAALGHSYEDVVTPPTCTEAGYKTNACTLCGDVKWSNENAEALGHSYDAVVTAPTCSKQGYTTYTCSVCGDSYVADYVDALGHIYEDGICTGCGRYENGVNTTYTFYAPDLTAEEDKEEIVDGSYVGTDDYFRIEGSVTKRISSGIVKYVELLKNEGGKFAFEVTGVADVTVKACSTSGSNTSVVALVDAEGNVIISDLGGVVEVTGTGNGTDITYTDLPAGTYYIVSPTENVYKRNTRIISINVVETGLPPVEKFDLVGANIDLGNSLTMNFFIPKSEVADESYYVEIVKEVDGADSIVTIIPCNKFVPYYDYWQVSLENLAAKEMADDIFVTVYNGDGVAVSNTWNDSIRDYCVRQLSNPTQSRAYTLLVDMLNYGAAAQVNFSYNTGDLANSTLTAEQAAYATKDFNLGDYSNNTIKGDNFIGSSLSLETRIVLSMYFNNPGAASAEGLVAKISYTDHTGVDQVIEIAEADFVTMGSFYGVEVNTLVAADVCQLVTLEVYDGDTLVAYGADSVESYAVRQGGDINTALMIFSLSAYDYLH